MKKNNIFRHELNESIQANAALNCLNNRNKHKQINEVAHVVAAAGRMLLPMLRPVITKLVQKALVKIGTHARPTQVITLVMNMLSKGEFAKKMAEKCGQTWNEIPSDVKKEIQDAIIAAFKKQAPQEQEETVDYAQLADDVCASYRGPLSKLDLKDSINYIVKMVAKKIGKTVDTLTPQELTAIQKAAKHSVWYVSEQEESSLDTEYFSDLEEQEAYYENFRAIAELVADQIDKENGKGIDNNMDTLFEIVREVWNNNPDDLYIWDFDDVQENDCYKFFDKYYETIKNEYLKREHNNIMAATHDDLFASEQEELPQMERQDMILALSEYMAESWVDTGDDGDLDDIYYAVADILDKTGDYPASTSWEDCKPWCQKHYKEVEETFLGGGF